MTMTCWEPIQGYALRSIGIGEPRLPTSYFTLCRQSTLIGLGII